jgi:CheY-like chemotaxis protein
VTKAKVLYIEDDSASRRLVNRLLSSSGFEVLTAADGLEGVALAHKMQPNLILMDINLPNMDGRALTTRLRSSPYFTDTPIIALTAQRDADDRKMALAAGCTGFLTKPIDVDAFPQQIASFLQGQSHKLTRQDHQKHLERHTQELVVQLEDKVRELERANQHMEELNQLKSEFLEMASHDLQAPLDLTRQYLEDLANNLEAAPSRDDTLFNLVDRMRNGISRMQTVSDEIEHISDIMSGLLKLRLSPLLVNYIRPWPTYSAMLLNLHLMAAIFILRPISMKWSCT